MHRRHLGFAAAGVVLIVLAVAVAFQRAQEPVPVPALDTTATSSPDALPGSESGGDDATPASGPAGSELAAASQQTAPASSVIGTSKLTVLEPESTATLLVEGISYPLTAPEGSTLKEAMDRLVAESGFTYEYRSHAGLGAFVTKINGRASDGNHYWILYVNGERSASGISSMRIRSGDLIEWQLDKSY